jgi:hypothetical protein
MKKILILISSGFIAFSSVKASSGITISKTETITVSRGGDQKALKKRKKELNKRARDLKSKERTVNQKIKLNKKEAKLDKRSRRIQRKEINLNN